VGTFALLQWTILAVLLVAAWPLALPILLGEGVGGWMLVRHYMRATSTNRRAKHLRAIPSTYNHAAHTALLQSLQTASAQLVQVAVNLWGYTRGWVERRRQQAQQRQAARVAAWQGWRAQQIAQQRAAQEAAVQAQQAERARLQAIEVQRWAEAERARQVERARVEAIQAQRREEAERIRQAEISRRKTLDGLLSLSPTEFERAVGAMLVTYGYSHVKHTGGAGDLAADLICFDSDGNRIVVQCKRYAVNNLVGSREVQMFIGMAQVHHRATRGLFVTTSDFTQPARTLGNSHREFLTLIDGKLLTKMMQRLS
jgi:hypothetical protein